MQQRSIGGKTMAYRRVTVVLYNYIFIFEKKNEEQKLWKEFTRRDGRKNWNEKINK